LAHRRYDLSGTLDPMVRHPRDGIHPIASRGDVLNNEIAQIAGTQIGAMDFQWKGR
jgi:hypothetical protein